MKFARCALEDVRPGRRLSQTPMQVNVTGLFIWAVRIVTLRTSRVGLLAVTFFYIGMRIESH